MYTTVPFFTKDFYFQLNMYLQRRIDFAFDIYLVMKSNDLVHVKGIG